MCISSLIYAVLTDAEKFAVFRLREFAKMLEAGIANVGVDTAKFGGVPLNLVVCH
jgi:hypothetical protein